MFFPFFTCSFSFSKIILKIQVYFQYVYRLFSILHVFSSVCTGYFEHYRFFSFFRILSILQVISIFLNVIFIFHIIFSVLQVCFQYVYKLVSKLQFFSIFLQGVFSNTGCFQCFYRLF